ncbi:hypothetical protein [Nocardioides pacificus]
MRVQTPCVATHDGNPVEAEVVGENTVRPTEDEVWRNSATRVAGA